MRPLFHRLDPRLGHLFLSGNTLGVAFCGLILGFFCTFCAGQNTKGLAVVGNGGTSPTNSQMLIDATQFLGGTVTDMCGAIKAACDTLASTGYPAGAVIDARGFTGNQVCKASNITTMLFDCVTPHNNLIPNSGKLLLGEVNLYADGPASGNYTDNVPPNPSGIGTPALIIPKRLLGN